MGSFHLDTYAQVTLKLPLVEAREWKPIDSKLTWTLLQVSTFGSGGIAYNSPYLSHLHYRLGPLPIICPTGPSPRHAWPDIATTKASDRVRQFVTSESSICHQVRIGVSGPLIQSMGIRTRHPCFANTIRWLQPQEPHTRTCPRLAERYAAFP